ncbi:MAG: thioredoxin [Chitinivibrionales bacterium]|nr:thioredoxin [Chitinivibrionales bacterium]
MHLSRFFNIPIIILAFAAISPAQPVHKTAQAQTARADSSQKIADKIIKSDIPVLIDFWAVWCMPCKMLDPIIKEVKKKYDGKIEVMKVNVDVHRQIAAYFKISSIPAVFIVNDKAVVKHLMGVQPKEAYFKAIEEVLAMKSNPPQEQPKSKKKSSAKES